jgi:hydrogenase nickel incorporation protein HypA/HybF
MQQAMEIALDHARRTGATKIERIRLRVGALSGAVPDAMAFAFDVISPGTMAEGAKLEWECVPVACTCLNCELFFKPSDFPHVCPGCGSNHTRLDAGRELEVASLEVS